MSAAPGIRERCRSVCQGHEDVLLGNQPTRVVRGKEILDHTGNVGATIPQRRKDARTDGGVEIEPLARDAIADGRVDILEVNVPNAAAVLAHRIARLAITVRIVPGVEANTDQAGIGQSAKALLLFGSGQMASRFEVNDGS